MSEQQPCLLSKIIENFFQGRAKTESLESSKFPPKNGCQLEKTLFLGHVSARQTLEIDCHVFAWTFWWYLKQKFFDQSAPSMRKNWLFAEHKNQENATSISDNPSGKTL